MWMAASYIYSAPTELRNLRIMNLSALVARAEGSRIVDVPPSDSETVYGTCDERVCPAAAPCTCSRLHGSANFGVLNLSAEAISGHGL
jgi:hypothetical protein